MDVFQESVRLNKNQKPSVEFRDESRQRQVQLWKVKDLHFSDGYTHGSSAQVVRSEERWTERSVQGGRKQAQAQQSRWMWVAARIFQNIRPSSFTRPDTDDRRWEIENQAFNDLTQAYHLTHCYIFITIPPRCWCKC